MLKLFGMGKLFMSPENGDGGGGGGGGNNDGGSNTGTTGSTSNSGGSSSGGGIGLTRGGSQSSMQKSGDAGGQKTADGKTADGGANGTADGQGGGNNGSTVTDWRSDLSEDLKKNKSLEKFKDKGALAQAYLSMERLASSKGVAVPNEKTATKEDWDNFYKQIGRPEAADKYELAVPEEAKALKVNPNFEKEFRGAALDIGLTATQAKKLYGWYMGSAAKMSGENSKAAIDRGTAMVGELQKEWGGDFEANVNKAQVAVSEFVKDEKVIKWMQSATVDGMKLEDHPMFARIMAAVGDGLSEDTFKQGHGENIGKSASDIQKEIDGYVHDPKSAYNDVNHGGYHTARQHVLTLRQELNRMQERAKKR